MWDDPQVCVEEKLDGWRIIVEGDKCYARSTKPLPVDFCELPEGTIADGELIVRRDLPQGDHEVKRWLAQDPGKLAVVLFDLLQDRGEDIRHLPLSARKIRLSAMVAGLRYPRVTAHGWRLQDKLGFHRRTIQAGGEGVVLKDLRQPYTGRAWIKMRPDECEAA